MYSHKRHRKVSLSYVYLWLQTNFKGHFLKTFYRHIPSIRKIWIWKDIKTGSQKPLKQWQFANKGLRLCQKYYTILSQKNCNKENEWTADVSKKTCRLSFQRNIVRIDAAASSFSHRVITSCVTVSWACNTHCHYVFM